jgi:oligopeptide transport system substrate-binding protein
MKSTLSRRQFAAASLGLFAGLGLVHEQALARMGLQADGTPVGGEAVVVTTRRPLPPATPSGEQLFRVTGPIVGPETIDPAMVRDLSSAFLTRLMFRGLVVFDAELNPALELAERVEISGDGLTYTFAMDPKAVFHSGRAITAQDVVFSFTRAVNPKTAGGQAALLSGPTFLSSIAGVAEMLAGTTETLSGITAIDDATVEITLSAPSSPFLMKLGAAATSIVDPDDVAKGDGWWMTPNGSGPFHISEWTPGQQMVLTPVSTFVDGAPALQKVQILLGPNAGSAFNLYQAEKVDICGIGSNDVDRVTSTESGLADQLVQSDLFATEYAAFRTDAAPMDDLNVRKAVAMSFPRAKIAEVQFGGHVNVAEGLVPNGMLGVPWPVKALPYDPDAAKAAFAESKYAGVAEVDPIQIYSTGNSFVPALREAVKNVLGLELDAVTVQSTEFFDGLALRQYPAYGLYWGADYPDPSTFLGSLFQTGSSDNYIDYSNPDFDALMDEAATEQDIAKRAETYMKAQQLLIDDAVLIPTYHDVGYMLLKPGVKGFEYTPLGLLQLETIWIER